MTLNLQQRAEKLLRRLEQAQSNQRAILRRGTTSFRKRTIDAGMRSRIEAQIETRQARIDQIKAILSPDGPRHPATEPSAER